MLIPFTHHARCRLKNRHIPESAVEAALEFGSSRMNRGAEIITIGQTEYRFWLTHGVDLEKYIGLRLVVGHDGVLVTAYRRPRTAALRKPYRREKLTSHQFHEELDQVA